MYRYHDEVYYRVREIGVRKYLVEVPIRRSVRGYVGDGDRFRENLVLLWFYRGLYGVLNDQNVPVTNYGCSGTTIYGNTQVTYDTGGIAISGDTAADRFDYCGQLGSLLTTNAVTGMSTDRTRVTLSAVATGAAADVRVLLRNGTGGSDWVVLARKLMSISAGQNIVYQLDFLAPWTYNMGVMWEGFIMYRDVNGTAIDGAAYTIRTTGDFSQGNSYLVAASGNPGWAPDRFSLPNPISLTTIMTLQLDTVLAILNYVGVIAPTVDTSIDTLGIQEPLLTASGIKHFLLAVIPLGQTITLKANRNNVIYLRLVAI